LCPDEGGDVVVVGDASLTAAYCSALLEEGSSSSSEEGSSLSSEEEEEPAAYCLAACASYVSMCCDPNKVFTVLYAVNAGSSIPYFRVSDGTLYAVDKMYDAAAPWMITADRGTTLSGGQDTSGDTYALDWALVFSECLGEVDIANTSDDYLYYTIAAGGDNTLTYSFPVTMENIYRVTVHFSRGNRSFTKRILDTSIDGNLVDLNRHLIDIDTANDFVLSDYEAVDNMLDIEIVCKDANCGGNAVVNGFLIEEAI
jgi:hypothetical protein